jgi:hypothetical protein
MNNKNESFGKDEPILAVIQGIRDGTVKPRMLTIEVRQACVEALLNEGYSEIQAAQILQRCEKTIQRDIQVIHEKNALTPSLEFAKQFVGDVLRKGLAHHDYLVRLSNSGSASDSDKIQARASAWNIMNQLVERMQSLGYLPLRPREIVGDLFHHIDDQGVEKSFQDVRKAISDVIDVAQQCGTLTPELQENVNTLQQRVEKAEIVQQVEKLSKQSNEVKEENHDK